MCSMFDENHNGRASQKKLSRCFVKLGDVGELAATQKLTMTAISVGTGVLDGPKTMGVDILYGDVKTF